MWCLVSISQSEIGWKPSLIKALRNKGLACSAAETLTEAFIAEVRDCLSVSEGVWPSVSHRGVFFNVDSGSGLLRYGILTRMIEAF
jgi:hypothetical protein